MKAIANSSVLIALCTIGQLSLLRNRFPEGLLVPPAVWQEVVATGEGRPGSAEVAGASWITVHEVRDTSLVSLLRVELDAGEAQAIALCRETGAQVVLLDEKGARQVARRFGLSVLGTVGMLIWAKRAGLIANLRQQLDVLQTQGRFRLSQSVYEEALRTVGEYE